MYGGFVSFASATSPYGASEASKSFVGFGVDHATRNAFFTNLFSGIPRNLRVHPAAFFCRRCHAVPPFRTSVRTREAHLPLVSTGIPVTATRVHAPPIVTIIPSSYENFDISSFGLNPRTHLCWNLADVAGIIDIKIRLISSAKESEAQRAFHLIELLTAKILYNIEVDRSNNPNETPPSLDQYQTMTRNFTDQLDSTCNHAALFRRTNELHSRRKPVPTMVSNAASSSDNAPVYELQITLTGALWRGPERRAMNEANRAPYRHVYNARRERRGITTTTIREPNSQRVTYLTYLANISAVLPQYEDMFAALPPDYHIESIPNTDGTDAVTTDIAANTPLL
ncbi:hypothetical protein B0H16DRAFT_1897091 [Mycena metata]|uniref:Uncharacterized protein n=1 Tax=Mycena metata TaxID=1033252 RepID=A0AAD7HFN1_9AGAR|nr:hypothetical protein B0H16DRAFT_1897091 [Mycena metata]